MSTIATPFSSVVMVAADTSTSNASTQNSTTTDAPVATRYPLAGFAGFATNQTASKSPTFYTANSGLNKDLSQLTHSSGLPIVVNTDGAPATPTGNYWNVGASWIMQVSSLGYQNLQISSQQMSNAKGPGDFTLEYSTDYNPVDPTSGTWTTVDDAKKIEVSQKYNTYLASDGQTSNGTGAGVVKNASLPESLSNMSKFFVRWRQTSRNTAYAAPGKPGAATAEGTNMSTSRLNNVVLTGTRYYGENDAKADLDDGTLVPKGQTINLTVANTDATIHYKYNNGNEVTAPEKNHAAVTIDQFNDAHQATIEAWTESTDGTKSTPITYTYSQKTLSPVTSNKSNGSALRVSTPVKLSETDDANAKIFYKITSNVGSDTQATSEEKVYDADKPLTFTADQFPLQITTRAESDNYLKSDETTYSYTLNSTDTSKLKPYFGGFHAHTMYSDGIGKPSDAFKSSKDAGLDFEIVTDHSNYFEAANTTTANQLVTNGTSDADSDGISDFTEGFQQAAAATTSNFLAMYGFEMTWSSGPGHINTLNMTTADAQNAFTSRQNSWYNNKTDDIGLQRYYDTLATLSPNAVSQFNHPGPTFGNFDDFSYWTPARDSAMSLVEVGNGEGVVHQTGYFPSYDEYFLALDKGWHVAPSNNQDNHKGKWGAANDARTVVLADKLDKDSITSAMKNRHVYASEDKNTTMSYTLNDEVMGTVLDNRPDTVNIKASLSDPDSTDKIQKVELLGNGGKVIATQTYDNANTVTFDKTLPDNNTYYVVKATEADGDIIISAPVWTGTVEKVGLNDLKAAQSMAIKGQKVTLNADLYNNEASDFKISKITYKTGNTIINEDTTPQVVTGSTTKTLAYDWIPDTDGTQKVSVIVEGTLNGETKTFTKDLSLSVKDPNKLVKIAIDGAHNNFYVNDTKYPGKFTTFTSLAAAGNATVTTLTDPITKDVLDQYSAFLISAPQLTNTNKKVYTAAEIEVLKEWSAEPGKTLVVMGTADYSYDTKSTHTPAPDTDSSEQLNQILKAVGSAARIGDDEVIDDAIKVNEDYRLSFTGANFNINNQQLMSNLDPTQVYSFYSGASVHTSDETNTNIQTLVSTHTPSEASDGKTVAKKDAQGYIIGADGARLTDAAGKTVQDVAKVADQTQVVQVPYEGTTSIDTDQDGFGMDDEAGVIQTAPKGGTAELTSETLPSGSKVVAAGTAFLSDFEVAESTDYAAALPSANTTIAKNLISEIAPTQTTSIKDVLNSTQEGEEFTIEGTLTSNSSGLIVDGKPTSAAFAEGSTYMSDGTGSINIFPLIDPKAAQGLRVQITGTLGAYYGEKELRVTSYKILSNTPETVTPITLTPQQARSNAAISQYIKTVGTVTSVDLTEGKLMLDNVLPVYIDGYITPSVDISDIVKVGNKIEVTGFGSRYLTGTDQITNPDGSKSTNMNDTDDDLNLRVVDRHDIKLVPADTTPTDPVNTTATVTFVANGATAPAEQTVKTGESITLPAGPNKAGYVFSGWLGADGKTLYAAGKTVTISESTTFVAQYTPQITYQTVTFSALGATSVPRDQSVKTGSTFTLPAGPVKNGYHFDAWLSSVDGKRYSAAAKVTITRDTKFTAIYTAYQTVSYVATGATAPASQSVLPGTTVTLPKGPAKKGYVFKNWTANGKTYKASAKVKISTSTKFTAVYLKQVKTSIKVNTIYSLTKIVRGTVSGAPAGSTITVSNDSGKVIGKAKLTSKGAYSLKLSTLKANAKLTLKIAPTDTKTSTYIASSKTVKVTASPKPAVKHLTISAKTHKLSLQTTANAVVKLYNNKKKLVSTYTVPANGKLSKKISSSIKKGQKVQLIVTNNASHGSNKTTVSYTVK
jgi:uncharacterized repeat protein (TIGR02543 family)